MAKCENCIHCEMCGWYEPKMTRACEYYLDNDMTVIAIEKQKPYKPKEYEDKFYVCKCGNVVLMKWEKYPTELTPKSEGLPYCLACGQALDWSENNE